MSTDQKNEFTQLADLLRALHGAEPAAYPRTLTSSALKEFKSWLTLETFGVFLMLQLEAESSPPWSQLDEDQWKMFLEDVEVSRHLWMTGELEGIPDTEREVQAGQYEIEDYVAHYFRTKKNEERGEEDTVGSWLSTSPEDKNSARVESLLAFEAWVARELCLYAVHSPTQKDGGADQVTDQAT